jgi:GT2 family glycosyltransferase
MATVTVVLISYGWSGKKRDFFEKFPTIVIENNPAATSKKISVVQYVQNEVNVGFSKAANQGTQLAKSDYILFLNDDCSISAKQISELVKEAKSKNWQAISPTFVDTNGNVQQNYQQPIPTFWSLVVEWSPLHRFLKMPSGDKKKTLPGGCLLIEKSVLEKIGGWDERFWLWWEDVDLSYRLEEEDIKFGISEDIKVEHVGGQTFAEFSDDWRKQVFFHSLQIFAQKHFPRWQAKVLSVLTSRFAKSEFYPVDQQLRSSIIVPNMRRDLLENFLSQNLKHWDVTKDELIIVTSASEIENLRKKHPQIVWIHLSRNKGFADTVNVGFRRARGQWLGTANDDTSLPKDWISILIKNAPDRSGSLCPIVLKPNGEVESAGIRYFVKGKAEPIKTLPKQMVYTDVCNAAVVLFSRQALQEVGLFDAGFGSYLEDVDLGLRLRSAGWLNVVIPQVQVVHVGHQTSSARPIFTAWLNLKNWWFVVLKNYRPLDWLQHGPHIFLERGRNISGFLKTLLK